MFGSTSTSPAPWRDTPVPEGAQDPDKPFGSTASKPFSFGSAAPKFEFKAPDKPITFAFGNKEKKNENPDSNVG
jgi:hypothetical protein